MTGDEELRSLVRDVRRWADHLRNRGVTGVLPWSDVPEPQSDIHVASVRPTLQATRELLGDCRRCSLCSGRNQIVYGEGSETADLFVIGEGPGEQEDLRGVPFVGPAGEMLEKMLANVVGVPRSAVYIANVVKCRPPQNRNPSPSEVESCLPFLRAQIAAVQPKVVLVLGTVALKALWGAELGIMKARGKWLDMDGIPAMPTFHPAYLLRTPADKRLTMADLLLLKERYDALGGWRP